jgi:hypothetical protein
MYSKAIEQLDQKLFPITNDKMRGFSIRDAKIPNTNLSTINRTLPPSPGISSGTTCYFRGFIHSTCLAMVASPPNGKPGVLPKMLTQMAHRNNALPEDAHAPGCQNLELAAIQCDSEFSSSTY